MTDTDSIPVTLQTLLRKIEYVGLIKRGKKPNVTNMTFVDTNTWSGYIYRKLWLWEKHDKMMKYIDETIEEAIASLKTYKEGPFREAIIESLRSARTGMLNLKKTYNDNPEVVTWATVVIRNIGIQIGDDTKQKISEESEEEKEEEEVPPPPPHRRLDPPPLQTIMGKPLSWQKTEM